MLVTGIQAGANISGDLRDPAKSIPKGTMLALLISMFSYATFVIFAGGSALRDASGNVADLQNGTLLHVPLTCMQNHVTRFYLLFWFVSLLKVKIHFVYVVVQLRTSQFICGDAINVRMGSINFCWLFCCNLEYGLDKFVICAPFDSSAGH